MQIDFIHVCDYAIVDQHGKLSVVGIFRRVLVSAFPANISQMFLAFQTSEDPKEVRDGRLLRIEIRAPNDDLVFNAEAKIVSGDAEEVGRSSQVTHSVRITNLILNHTGVYRVALSIDGVPTGGTEIEVVQAQVGQDPL